MAEFAALPLFTDAWLADTAHLTRVERGLYMDLIILIWRSPGCRVPNDYDWIARKLRIDGDEEEIMEQVISEFCQSDGNWITQKRLSKEHVYVTEKSRQQSARANMRWNKDKVVCQGNAAPHASGNAPSPSPSPTKKERNSPTESKERTGAIAPHAPKETPRSNLEGALDQTRAQAVLDHRQRIGKALTPYAAKLLAGKLAKCPDPNAAADAMIANGWQGFEPHWLESRGRVNGHGPPGQVDIANELIREYQERGNGEIRDGSSGVNEIAGHHPPALTDRNRH